VGSDTTTNELTVATAVPIVTVDALTTSDARPELKGTVNDPAAVVTVTVAGGTYGATNRGDGTWTLGNNRIWPALADGVYDVSVVATAASGHAGVDGTTDELTIDTQAPIVTVNALTTNDRTPLLTGTVNDAAAVVQVMVAGSTYEATNNGDGTWTLADDSISPALADGVYQVSVTATDPAGNVGKEKTRRELRVDTEAPTVTVNALTTKDQTPALTGTVNDAAAVVQVTIAGNTYRATNNGKGTWTLADDSISPALTDGLYDVLVTAMDPAGNVGTDGTTNELGVDMTAPSVAVDELTTMDTRPQLTGTVDDSAAVVRVTVAGRTYTATNNGDGTWTLADNTIRPPLVDGVHDVQVTATDVAGNVGVDMTTGELTVDTRTSAVRLHTVETGGWTPPLTVAQSGNIPLTNNDPKKRLYSFWIAGTVM
jgi:hypothetical protein